MTLGEIMALCHGPMPKRPVTPGKSAEEQAASALAGQVGKRLAALMSVVEWGQSQVGRLLNVDQSTVNKWVKGTRLPPPYHMITIAEQAGVTLDFLYRGKFTSEMRRDVSLLLAARYPDLVEESRRGSAGHQGPDHPATGAVAARADI